MFTNKMKSISMKIIDEASSKSASRLMFAYSCFAFAVFKIKKRGKRKKR